MHVTVSGATGFLGFALCKRLRELGFNVTGFGRNLSKGALLAEQGVHFVASDINDTAIMLAHTPSGCTFVHCAALSSVWGRRRDFYDANVRGTQTIAKVCVAKQVTKLIHISSPSVYGTPHHQLDLAEDTPLPSRSINYYAQTKRESEQVLEQYSATVPLTILRPQAIFGIGDPSIFPRLLRANVTRGIPLIEGGKAQLDITHVDNVAEAILCALRTSTPSGRVYNISNGEPCTFKALMDMLFAAIGQPIRWFPLSFNTAMWLARAAETVATLRGGGREPTLTRYGVCVLAKSRTLNIDRAKAELNYRAVTSLNMGLQEFAEHIKSQAATAGSSR